MADNRKQPNASSAEASSRYRKKQKANDYNLMRTYINTHNHVHFDPSSCEFTVDSDNSDIMKALEKQQFVLLKGWFKSNAVNVALLLRLGC